MILSENNIGKVLKNYLKSTGNEVDIIKKQESDVNRRQYFNNGKQKI